ncbi:MAG: hypothetical protein J2P17_35340, partial [Mycobacterium sp.]|nr:hypothetical protein [Mycobacterium sp.]
MTDLGERMAGPLKAVDVEMAQDFITGSRGTRPQFRRYPDGLALRIGLGEWAKMLHGRQWSGPGARLWAIVVKPPAAGHEHGQAVLCRTTSDRGKTLVEELDPLHPDRKWARWSPSRDADRDGLWRAWVLLDDLTSAPQPPAAPIDSAWLLAVSGGSLQSAQHDSVSQAHPPSRMRVPDGDGEDGVQGVPVTRHVVRVSGFASYEAYDSHERPESHRVPPGTEVTVYRNPGLTPSGELRNLIEAGGDLSGVQSITYREGDPLPCIMVHPAEALALHGTPITVSVPTLLDHFVKPSMGQIVLCAPIIDPSFPVPFADGKYPTESKFTLVFRNTATDALGRKHVSFSAGDIAGRWSTVMGPDPANGEGEPGSDDLPQGPWKIQIVKELDGTYRVAADDVRTGFNFLYHRLFPPVPDDVYDPDRLWPTPFSESDDDDEHDDGRSGPFGGSDGLPSPEASQPQTPTADAPSHTVPAVYPDRRPDRNGPKRPDPHPGLSQEPDLLHGEDRGL